MGNIYFIADTHFGDSAICRYEDRPFETIEQMDAVLIFEWNSVVTAVDTVYVLGDFGATDYEAEILKQLNGRKLLIKGNHDSKSNEEYRCLGFDEVYDHPIILDGFWILSHDALYVNTNMPYANLFGHIHNSPIVKDYSSHHFCVSAERIGYRPIKFEDIKRTISQLSKK